MKKHTEAIVVNSKVTGIEVTADKTKYMVLSRNHKTGRSHNVQIDSSSLDFKLSPCSLCSMFSFG